MTISATIASPVRIEGRGIFSGERCLCTVRPWEPGLPAPLTFAVGGKLIPALPQHFGSQPNCTTFSEELGTKVLVTEHLFAALWAARIDHALIETSRSELPNHDGSAITLFEGLAAAGLTELGERRVIKLDSRLRVESTDGAYIQIDPASAEIGIASPGGNWPLWIEYKFSHPQLGEQSLSMGVTRESAVRDLLPARTFATVKEAEALIAAGLLHNTHTEDAILLTPRYPLEAASEKKGSSTEYSPSTPLRFPDEFSRHKVLDLLGDIYCVPAEICGSITAVRSGHQLNRQLAQELYNLL